MLKKILQQNYLLIGFIVHNKQNIIKYAKKKGIPLILETPAAKKSGDVKKEINIIKNV